MSLKFRTLAIGEHMATSRSSERVGWIDRRRQLVACKPGREAEFEQAMRSFVQFALAFPGSSWHQHLAPAAGSRELHRSGQVFRSKERETTSRHPLNIRNG